MTQNERIAKWCARFDLLKELRTKLSHQEIENFFEVETKDLKVFYLELPRACYVKILPEKRVLVKFKEHWDGNAPIYELWNEDSLIRFSQHEKCIMTYLFEIGPKNVEGQLRKYQEMQQAFLEIQRTLKA